MKLKTDPSPEDVKHAAAFIIAGGPTGLAYTRRRDDGTFEVVAIRGNPDGTLDPGIVADLQKQAAYFALQIRRAEAMEIRDRLSAGADRMHIAEMKNALIGAALFVESRHVDNRPEVPAIRPAPPVDIIDKGLGSRRTDQLLGVKPTKTPTHLN